MTRCICHLLAVKFYITFFFLNTITYKYCAIFSLSFFLRKLNKTYRIHDYSAHRTNLFAHKNVFLYFSLWFKVLFYILLILCMCIHTIHTQLHVLKKVKHAAAPTHTNTKSQAHTHVSVMFGKRMLTWCTFKSRYPKWG